MNYSVRQISSLKNLSAGLKNVGFNFIAANTLAPPPIYSDSREGQSSWSLYGNSGSIPIKTTGGFPQRETNYYGMEGAPPGKVGNSRFCFAEEVQLCAATGSFTVNGVAQKIAGELPLMLSGAQIWSGQLIKNNTDKFDTPASCQYYITLSIKRSKAAGSAFHLAIYPISRAFNGGDVGAHKLSIYNESNNTLLQQQDLALSTDPRANFNMIYQVSDLVGANDIMRVEVVAQLALSNPNSPENPVFGGSICGIGFMDNVA